MQDIGTHFEKLLTTPPMVYLIDKNVATVLKRIRNKNRVHYDEFAQVGGGRRVI